MMSALPLTESHKYHRVLCVKSHLTKLLEQLGNFIVSDKKKFDLDSADGLEYYWHNLRREKNARMSRQMRVGSVVIWTAVSAFTTFNLTTSKEQQNNKKFTKVLLDFHIYLSGNKTILSLFSRTGHQFTQQILQEIVRWQTCWRYATASMILG